jgi:hypothetical protein
MQFLIQFFSTIAIPHNVTRALTHGLN